MGISEKIIHFDTVNNSYTGNIPIHEFTAAVGLYFVGSITAEKVISEFNLDSDDINDLQNIKSAFDALSTVSEKAIFLQKIEWAGIFYQNGKITASQYANIISV